jgi:hypothetical protein
MTDCRDRMNFVSMLDVEDMETREEWDCRQKNLAPMIRKTRFFERSRFLGLSGNKCCPVKKGMNERFPITWAALFSLEHWRPFPEKGPWTLFRIFREKDGVSK